MVQLMAWLVDRPECSRKKTVSGDAHAKEYLAKIAKRLEKLHYAAETRVDGKRGLVLCACVRACVVLCLTVCTT